MTNTTDVRQFIARKLAFRLTLFLSERPDVTVAIILLCVITIWFTLLHPSRVGK